MKINLFIYKANLLYLNAGKDGNAFVGDILVHKSTLGDNQCAVSKRCHWQEGVLSWYRGFLAALGKRHIFLRQDTVMTANGYVIVCILFNFFLACFAFLYSEFS